MGQKYDHITPATRRMIEKQKMYFVATAPMAADGHINMSPKGYSDRTFAVLGDNRVAYLDLTGSGVETLAHVKENGRITFMFASFDAVPCITRLFGRAVAHERGTPEFDALVAEAFPAAAAPAPHPGFAAGARSVIVADVYEVTTACGYAVPLYDFKAERDTLVSWAENKGPEAMDEYRRAHAASLDGLPARGASGA